MTENEIAKIVEDSAYQIHKQLGPGLLDIMAKVKETTK